MERVYMTLKATFITFGIFLIFINSNVSGYEIDLKNPIEVARAANELGLKFEYKDLRSISCDEILDNISEAEIKSNEAIELFRKHGIDYKKKAKYEFSEIKYSIIENTKNFVKIKVIGNYNVKIENKYNKTMHINTIFKIKKINNLFHFCGMYTPSSYQ